MTLLVGRHTNKIDKKGRVSVPKVFRAVTAHQEFNGVFAYPLFKHPAIEVCDEAFMTRISDSLDALDMFSDEQDDLATVIMNHAEALGFDPEGRIVLPGRFLEHADISDQAIFVGRGRRFQIWNPETFELHNRRTFERARSSGVTLPLRPDLAGLGGGED
jgi:MraZ protein